MRKNKVVESVNDNDEKVTVIVKSPTPKQEKESMLFATSAFKKAMEVGAIPRDRIDSYMRENHMWDEEKDKMYTEITHKIIEGEKQLSRGGVTKEGKSFSKKEARDLALNMRMWRAQQILMLAEQRRLDEYSLEGQAENAKFNYLVFSCSFYEDGKHVFDSVDDYENRRDTKLAYDCASALGHLIHGIDPDYEKKRPENRFLVEYKFAREDDLYLIDDKGRLVDSEGRLIDKNGRWINEEGQFIDHENNVVDQDGNLVQTFTPFTD